MRFSIIYSKYNGGEEMRLVLNKTENEMLKMNRVIHAKYENLEYHMNHIILTRDYLVDLNNRLGLGISFHILDYIGLGHDLLKERGLDPESTLIYNGISIPQDPNRYVRENLDVLKEFGLEDYFNSDLQYHALAAGIFLYKEMHVIDPYILYPVMFHSCPIMDVYYTLPTKMQTLVDMTILADKLSSNWLRINMLEKDVCCDLDLILYGSSGKEFNYAMALYMARLISYGKSDGEQSKMATRYYYEKLVNENPLISRYVNDDDYKIGGKKKWQKRNPRLKTRLRISLK
jgi:hypothetical protein